jgi:prophage maintenance system killer protein
MGRLKDRHSNRRRLRQRAMVWYPSVDDVVYSNLVAISLGNDRHPHRLRRSRKSIQAVLDCITEVEDKGLVYEAAMLMKEIVRLHAFESGNHRTAFLVASLFLTRNGRRMRVERFGDAYAFIRDLETKNVEQIQDWIEHGSPKEPQ